MVTPTFNETSCFPAPLIPHFQRYGSPPNPEPFWSFTPEIILLLGLPNPLEKLRGQVLLVCLISNDLSICFLASEILLFSLPISLSL